jgi:hypothetical protein
MTHACCPTCRLRFNRAAVAHLADCPHCGGLLARLAGAHEVVGFRLAHADGLVAPPIASAVALTRPVLPEPHA